MHRGFAAELQRVVIVAVICILFGLSIGQLTWTLIVGGACYMGWTLWQIHRLDRWLHNKEPGLPPDASGIWGDIFDRIYHLQKRQNREKQRLQSLLNRVQETTAALPDAVVLLDNRGIINWWNETASELLGLQRNDNNQPLVNFVRHPQFVRYFDSGDYREPIIISAPNNDAKQLQVQITRYGQGEQLVLVRDVTRIQRLEQIRQDFVANVSHELRTPLTVIKGYLETLGDYAPDVAPNWVKPIAQMQDQSQRMSLLINDLITLSRLETEDPEDKHALVNIRSLLSSVRSEAEVLAAGKQQISAEAEVPGYLRGSQKELHSAISNLVVNAIKYSPEGSNIQISAKLDDKTVAISVKDNGIGIDPIHIPRLTERFYRVDNSRSINTGGTGLGLAIVKHVLLRHQGKLEIHSEPGKGSTFTCVFPRSQYQPE